MGHLSKKAAETTGLRSGIALISGAGDKIAGCVGANVLKKGDMIFEAAGLAAWLMISGRIMSRDILIYLTVRFLMICMRIIIYRVPGLR